jgi:Icc-related predicted phosphoesterase
MIVNYCSDLHLEHNKDLSLFNTNNADMLILAGDIIPIKYTRLAFNDLKMNGESNYITEFFDNITNQFEHIIYVLGNHEFYDSDINDVSVLRKTLKQYTNLHILENESITIDNNLFIGGTCWTKIKDPVLEVEALNRFSDYIYISNSDRNTTGYYTNKLGKLLPSDTSMKCDNFIYYVSKQIESTDVDNVIVISHHCPTPQGIPDKFKGNFWNDLFTNHFDDYIIQNERINYWIHGHVHDVPRNYKIGETNILLNVYGYPVEEYHEQFELKTFIL